MSEEPYIIVGPQTARKIATRSRRWLVYGVPAAGVLVLAGLLAAVLWPRGGGATVLVKRGDLVHAIVGNGRVECESTVEITPSLSAPIAKIHVQEGDSVEVGQVLVTLEHAPLLAQREEAARAVAAAQAKRDEILRGTRVEDLERAAAQVREAEGERKRAEAKLAEVLRGPRSEDLEEAKAQLSIAKEEADRWAREWDRFRELKDQYSESERDEVRRRHETAQAAYRQAKARHDRVRNGATEEEKAQARAAVAIAQARLDQAKANHARLVRGPTEEERRLAEAELERARATFARLEAEVAQLTLTSPIRGVVLRRSREPREMAAPTMSPSILTLGETSKRVVRLEVEEGDIYKLREGQKARITSDAYPGRAWAGTLTKIPPVLGKKSLVTESPREKSDVKVLEVRITPDEPLELPVSLPVEVRIRETVRQNVLLLPARAVDVEGRVRLANGQLRAIKTGARDDGFVEILGGLAEGEKVRLPE